MVYYFLERIFIRYVINQYCTIGHSVINRPQGMKPLLSGCIPYRQVYSSSIEIELFLDKWRLYQPVDMITHNNLEQLYFNNITTSAQRPMYRQWPSSPTCSVLTCLSLNLSSVYRSTSDVFPTHPSPNRTTLKLCAVVLLPVEVRPSPDSSILTMLLVLVLWNVTFVRTTHDLWLNITERRRERCLITILCTVII